MPSRDTSRIVATIAYNIELAHRFIDGLSFEAFETDERAVYAVTRCLEIISEASRRLPIDLKSRHPIVPWEKIAGAGNVYRHDYEDILARIIWDTVRDHLGVLAEAMRVEMSNVDRSDE